VAHAAEASSVLELTPQNFDAALSGRRVLVEMYAPWCPYCAKLEPLWTALPAELARTPGAPRHGDAQPALAQMRRPAPCSRAAYRAGAPATTIARMDVDQCVPRAAHARGLRWYARRLLR